MDSKVLSLKGEWRVLLLAIPLRQILKRKINKPNSTEISLESGGGNISLKIIALPLGFHILYEGLGKQLNNVKI